MNEPNNGTIQHLFVIANTSRGQVNSLLLTREQQRLVVEYLLKLHAGGIRVTRETISGLGVAAPLPEKKVA